MEIPKLFLPWFLFFLSILTQSSSRTLTSPPSTNHHHPHHAISFYMPDVLTDHKLNHPLPKQTKTEANRPFSEPSNVNPKTLQTQTLKTKGISMSFPGIATLQELEMGIVTNIDEDIYRGSELLGKVEGMYVAGSEDGNSNHMMAITASFGGNDKYNKDELRFFGVHRSGDHHAVESHIAVIGGTGKYLNANGYAILKTHFTLNTKLLEFNVFLG